MTIDAVDTTRLAALAPALRAAFLTHDYTVDGLEAGLGPAGVAALARSDAAAVLRRTRGLGPKGDLLRLFVCGVALPRDVVARLVPDLDLDAAVGAGLLRVTAGSTAAGSADTDSTGDARDSPSWLVAALDLRPVDTGRGPQWFFSDIDGSMVPTRTRPDHVLGVGQASLSLLRVTPPTPVSSLLDLGTGCGIQLVAANAERRVGTDITARCLDLAAATCAINEVDADLRPGSWFEPVEGETFARIVANPPFVVGTPDVAHSYRESGLPLDGATELVVSQATRHLEPGGVATLLGAWILRDDEDWRHRLASWLPTEGVSAWVLLRDAADPEQYVWTWLTDEGGDPRTAEYRDSAHRWLDHFAAERVAGIGFGYVFLQAIDGPTEIVCEELTHAFEDGLGAEAMAHFERARWLRATTRDDLDATVFEVAPGVVVHTTELLENASRRAVAPEPPAPVVIERTSGPRWRHELDAASAGVLRGIEQGGLALADIAALAAAGFGLDPATAPDAVRTLVVDLMRHGLVVPRSLRGATLEEHLPDSVSPDDPR